MLSKDVFVLYFLLIFSGSYPFSSILFLWITGFYCCVKLNFDFTFTQKKITVLLLKSSGTEQKKGPEIKSGPFQFFSILNSLRIYTLHFPS